MLIDVVIPTRNRPDRLVKCLEALDTARNLIDFEVKVCDSSTSDSLREDVKEVCNNYKFVTLNFHNGKNVAAARNFCASVSSADLLINVDDDIYVQPEAIKKIYDAYSNGNGYRVVAGSVAWDEDWSTPVVMRAIGYGRKAKENEKPSFLIGAFFIYPRELAISLPWNENIQTSDDRFMGALWRSYKISLLYEPSAMAIHDHQHTQYDVKHQESHIYANMFDALIANFSLKKAFCYQFIGFLASAKLYGRNLKTVCPFLLAWLKGNLKFIKDYLWLRNYLKVKL